MIIKYVKTFKNKLARFWGNSCNLAKQLKPHASSQEENMHYYYQYYDFNKKIEAIYILHLIKGIQAQFELKILIV